MALCRSPSAAGPPDVAPRLWQAYAAWQASPDPLGRVESADERFYYRDVVVLDRVERVLAAVASHGQPTEFAAASLSFLQQLATLDVLRRRDELALRRRARQALLRDVLAGEGVADEVALRLREQGLEQEKVWRVIVVEPTRRARSAARCGRPARDRARDARRAARGAAAEERLADDVLRAVEAVLDRRRIVSLSAPVGRAGRGPRGVSRRERRDGAEPARRPSRRGGGGGRSAAGRRRVLGSADRRGERAAGPQAGTDRLPCGPPRAGHGWYASSSRS